MQESMNGNAEKISFERFTPRLMWQEVAPHTWPASILPVLCAIALAASEPQAQPLSLLTCIVLLLISVLMQASVNTFNDYYDYVKGADTVENSSDDVTDAVLVYNNINPKSALAFAVALLVAAFVLGVYIVYLAGWVPLAIALVGAFFVAAYSAGKTPISYYPIGELVSGFVMGALIMLACHYVLVGRLDPLTLLYALPLVIGIGLIMMTNNTCDIDKDVEAQRRTLPVLLGHDLSVRSYHAAIVVWVCAIVLLSVLHAALVSPGTNAWAAGALLVPFMLLTAYPSMRALWRNPMIPKTRDFAMPQILGVNVTLGLFYIVGLMLPALANIVF